MPNAILIGLDPVTTLIAVYGHWFELVDYLLLCTLIIGLVALGRLVGINRFIAAVIDNLIGVVRPVDVILPSTSIGILIERREPRVLLIHTWTKLKRLEHQ